MGKRRVMGVFLSIVIIGMLASGCSNANNAGEPKPDKEEAVVENSSNNTTEENKSENNYLASDKMLDLTIHMHYWNTIAFDDNWEVFKKAAELTNVRLKGTAAKTATNSAEVFNLMLTSKPLSDIVVTTKTNFDKFGEEGAFIPLTDLIEEHAPHLKQYLEENQDIAKSIKAPNGETYLIPFMPDGEAAKGWFIRQDWLDALNLGVPDTIDDFYEVLKAFKTMNPNGDANKEEIPYFNRSGNVMELVPFWGARSDWTVADNKVVWGPTQLEFKTAMVNVAKWYKEGLIDKEIFTRGGKSREILLGDDVGGITNDWFSSTALYNQSVVEQVPGINFIPIAPPKDVNGQRVEVSNRGIMSTGGWGISADNKYPVETIKFFDFWFTEEGRRIANFGVEGVTYDMVDGKPVFKDEILNTDGSVVSKLNEYGAQLEFGYKQDFEYEKQWMNELALQGSEMYIDNGYLVESFPTLTFTPEEQQKLDQIKGSITTYFNERVQAWVLGAEDVEAGFDNYLNTLQTMGTDEMIQVYQAAYDRYNQ